MYYNLLVLWQSGRHSRTEISMKPKVVTKRNLKMGKVPVWGTAIYSKNPIIELDKSLKGFDHLTILCHESLHLAFPQMNERGIRHGSKIIASTLWSQRYRRFEQ